MRKSYTTCLWFISLLIVGCLVLGGVYLVYDKDVSEETIVLVDGNLSINYLNGNVLKNRDEKEYGINFSVSNNSNDYASYSVNLEEVSNKAENISLIITNKTLNSVVSETVLPKEDSALIDNVQIASGETHTYHIDIKQEGVEEFKAVIKINEEKPEIETFAQTILKNNAVSNTTLTKVGEEIATEDEGLISDIDDAGSTYYFRGNVTNNYVSFADMTWRIVRINGDGTVKLILNEVDDTVQAFYKEGAEAFYAYEESLIQESLTSWYDFNLSNYGEYISIDKYCNDYNTTNETDYIYTSYARNVTNKIPTFNCLGKKVGTNIGLLTADEAIYAGATYQVNNTSYYLYNEKITTEWWTMTPAKGDSSNLYPFVINVSGALDHNVLGTYNRAVRPVISLIEEVTVTGSGTKDSPYIIQTK